MQGKDSVLLVDDDPAFLHVAGRILAAKGYEIATAPDAGQALSRAGERFYNVAVLDISLPDMHGTELLSRLLVMHPDILVIMLTGQSSVQNAVQSLNSGAFAYLEKPLNPDHLLSVIARGLEKQQLSLENRRLLRELERRNRETEILLAVAQSAVQHVELKPLFESALKEITDVMDYDAGYVQTLENGSLVLQGCRGFNRALAGQFARVNAGGSVWQRLCESAGPVAVERIDGSPEPCLAWLAQNGFQSYLAVPLVVGRAVVGVMGLVSQTKQRFTRHDIALLTAIAREIAMAVRNAQLYEEASTAHALRELDAMRTELLANVSHEMRTPLAAIKGFASSLLQEDVCFDEPTRRSFLETIDKEADKLNHLIEELLTMSRIEAGTFEVRKTPRSLEEVLDSVADTLISLTLKHHLKITIARALPRVPVDIVRIGEVIINLVENAAKYSPEGTDINIEACPRDGGVTVSVTDQGPGIPADYHDRIFQRFYRLEKKGSEPTPGTGLGLCISRGIIEKHGGRMWVESEGGKGARFSFCLPAGEGE